MIAMLSAATSTVAEDTSFKSISTVTEPPSDTEPPVFNPLPAVTVNELFTNSALATPPSLIVIAPELAAKLSAEKLAIPLFVVVASSPATVIACPLCVTSTPSPPAKVST